MGRIKGGKNKPKADLISQSHLSEATIKTVSDEPINNASQNEGRQLSSDATLEQLKQQTAQEKEERKPRKKRADVIEQEKQLQDLEKTKQGFGLAIEAILKIGCIRMPNPIPPTEMELDLAKQSVNQVIEKYSAYLLESGVEISALVVIGAILIPRLIVEKKEEKHEAILTQLKPEKESDNVQQTTT